MTNTTRSQQLQFQEETVQRFSSIETTMAEITNQLANLTTKLDQAMQTPPPPPNNFHETSNLSPHHPYHQHNHANPNRPLKLEMPRFDGSNPTAWIFKANQYFSYYDIPDGDRFTTASIYMDGAASSWFQWMHQNLQLTTWHAFTESLLNRFGPSPYHDLKGELSKLTQTSTVQAYYDAFEALANQVAGISPSFLQSCFESGLRRDIHREVRALQPTSLQQAYNLAKLMEDRIADIQPPSPYRLYHQPPPTEISHIPQNQPPLVITYPSQPMALPAPSPPPLLPNPNRPPPNYKPHNLPFHRLSPTQIADRKARGLCFNCNDRFHPGHVCNARLFYLVLANEGEEEIVEETPPEPEPPPQPSKPPFQP